MKLAQRIVLKYFQTKLKTLELFSTEKAGRAAFQLFCTPYTRRKNYQVPPIFQKASKHTFNSANNQINGFSWQSENPNGLRILICHGFDSFSYRFERYIEPLLTKGFEVFTFDAPAHGLSSGKTITALLYKEMILEAEKRHGPFDGIMAHSFGGLAAVLAVEQLKGAGPKRLVLIAPATETTRSVTDFCRYLKISPTLRREIEKIINQVGGHPPEWFSVSRVIQTITTPTLWLHDLEDTITPYEDMKHLTDMELPHLKFVITSGLGHSLYRDGEIAEKIIAFFEALCKTEPTLQ